MSDTQSQIESERETNASVIELAIVVALEAARPLAGGQRFVIGELDVLEVGRGEARCLDVRTEHTQRIGRLSIPDPWLSTVHFRIRITGGVAELEDAGSKNGTMVDGGRCSRRELANGARIEAARTALVFQRNRPMPAGRHVGLATFEPGLASQFEILSQLAATDLPLLIRGPTGSGKEVAASACHELSRRAGPFVAVNLAAVPATLLESELFGHRRGAFTGAIDDRPGVIRSAHCGTLFLDEVAELSPAGQAALLRVLQQREVVPVGATAPIPIDIRVIAATHEDLALRIAAGEFRQDLFARLAGHQITLPPLRLRRTDLGQLVATLLRRIAGDAASRVRMSRGAMRALFEHPWTMNIRELEHTLIRAVTLAGDAEIDVRHLAVPEGCEPEPAPVGDAIARDRQGLLELLETHAGNIAAVARALATSSSHVRRLLQREGIDLEAVRVRLAQRD